MIVMDARPAWLNPCSRQKFNGNEGHVVLLGACSHVTPGASQELSGQRSMQMFSVQSAASNWLAIKSLRV